MLFEFYVLRRTSKPKGHNHCQTNCILYLGSHLNHGRRKPIEWTGATWNPVTGCTKVSYGCRNCYAERMAHRLQAMGLEKYRNGLNVTIHPDVLKEPLRWKRPRLVFVNSMSDLFHEDVPVSFIQRVFNVMDSTPRYTFQKARTCGRR